MSLAGTNTDNLQFGSYACSVDLLCAETSLQFAVFGRGLVIAAGTMFQNYADGNSDPFEADVLNIGEHDCAWSFVHDLTEQRS